MLYHVSTTLIVVDSVLMLRTQICYGVVQRLTRVYCVSLPLKTGYVHPRELTSPLNSRSCWAFARTCTGGSSAAPGPGQISCSNEGARMWPRRLLTRRAN